MSSIGKVSQVMGAVVDVSFEDAQLPSIMNALEIDEPISPIPIIKTELNFFIIKISFLKI